MHMDVYIYYTVPAGIEAALQRAVAQLQDKLVADYGVRTALKRRVDGATTTTWMEIYTGVPTGFAEVIEHAAQDCGVTALLAGSRHCETFMDLAVCA